MAASGKNPKKRNSLAGTKKGTSKSARRLQASPEARDKKKAYDTEYHKSEARKKYRAKLNKANRDKGSYGNKDGKDESHDSKGKTKKESQSENRARNGKGGKSSKRKSTPTKLKKNKSKK
tara:strand:+ start:1429 stop:1788 length:360 start_codon:yes stop_codon:yes gene_type:complete